MSQFAESSGALGTKFVVAKIDELMKSRGVNEETRNAITNSVEMMYEYIPYAIKQGKDPADGKVLAEFLATKGKHMAKYLGNDSVNCGLAIVDLIKSVGTASRSSGALPLATLRWGLAVLDLIEVGNSCEAAQAAYYELFLREHSSTISSARSRAATLHMP
jgi:hypothetical protein